MLPYSQPRFSESIKADLLSSSQERRSVLLSKGQKGAIIGAMNKYVGCDDHRRLVFSWLFSSVDGQLSSKDLSEGQWHALWEWVDLHKDEDSQTWVVGENFPVESVRVLTSALRAYLKLNNKERSEYPRPDDLLLTGVDIGGEATFARDLDYASEENDNRLAETLSEKTLLSNTRFGSRLENREHK